jgi:glycosyltransferase 2 family protein
MNKKRLLLYGLVLALLVVLVYFQFRTWKNFDWATFWSESKGVSPWHILAGVGLIYVSYFLRALRWKIFLRPVRKNLLASSLVSPTLVGFTGLALLGRAGELIRPYLIARRTNLSFSSQMAAWAVERIFDVGAFTVLLVLAIFLPTDLRFLPNPDIYPRLRVAGFMLIALVTGLAFAALLVAKYGDSVARWVENHFDHLTANLGQRIALRIREFHGGLDTIHDFASFLQISGVSLLMWWLIALAYREVTHSYGAALQHMGIAKVLLLMGSSMLGSLVQLPGVGGGSQLATISALQHIFLAPHELAASCGLLLWLTTFISVVPAGLILGHHERISLRKLSEESARAEGEAETSSAASI